jgi:hypothetical protein
MLLVSFLTVWPATAIAQDTGTAKLLGQTAENGSLPIWSKPESNARQDLGKAARAYERGVFLIGYPKKGFGTGWVISKKNRLLITNAHVADIMHDAGGKLFAIPSGSSGVYKVEKVWYHPGVRRFLKGSNSLSVRSTDPNEGDVDPHSPDLALLQLSAGGPDLTVEFAPATPVEWASLFAQPVAITGFPGTDTTTWPALGDSAAMTYHEGVISRITNFEMNPGVSPAELQFLQYTMATWGGFSGSPVFLPNGRIAGVHNSASYKQNSGTGESKSIPHGIRVDCVLEMLVYLHFEERVPFAIDPAKINLERWTRPDEKSEKARADFAKAVVLVANADRLSAFQHQHEAAEEKCVEAMKLAPGYAWAWSVRSSAISNFYFDNYRSIAQNKAQEILQKAVEYSQKACQLDPSEPVHVIRLCLALNNLGHATGKKDYNQKVLDVMNKVLSSDNLPSLSRGRAISQRAIAHDNLHEVDAALRDHNEAVRLASDFPPVLESRGAFLQVHGMGDLGESDRARAKELRQKQN